RPTPARLRRALAACPVALVGVPPLHREGRAAPAGLAAADAAVAAAARATGDGVLLVVGLSETGRSQAHLHVAVAAGGSFTGGELSSGSTGRPPFVQLVDVAPTVLALRGVPQPAAMTGRPWRATAHRANGQPALPTVVAGLRDDEVAAQAVRGALPWFLGILIGLQLVGYAVAGLLARRGDHRAGAVATGTALAAAGGPVGSYVAQLTHWWRAPVPVAAVAATSIAVAVALAALAWAGPWRREPLGPPAVVAGVTALILAADVVTGSRLQMSSVFGYSPLVAGRFAGFGNVAYGVFAAAALLAATGLAAALLPGRGRRTAGVAVLAVGLAAIAVDGAPRWGSDFGGVLALGPAVGLLAMWVAGLRVTWRRIALAAGLSLVAVVAFALLDYARAPQAQTHLGRFAGQVLHGGAWPVMRRKAKANLHLLVRTPVNAVVPFATAYLGWLVARPRGRLAAAIRWRPVLGSGLGAVVVMSAIGFLVNDSGDAVPAMAMLVAIPFAIAVIGRSPAAGTASGRHAGHRGEKRASADPESPVLP
ncbi:MAG: hypothetical protein ACJ74O_03445, partial [Frankiaceae bacterium]